MYINRLNTGARQTVGYLHSPRGIIDIIFNFITRYSVCIIILCKYNQFDVADERETIETS